MIFHQRIEAPHIRLRRLALGVIRLPMLVDERERATTFGPGGHAHGDVGLSLRAAHFEKQLHVVGAHVFLRADQQRSEEQTSELQYLMRISYAVFCMKKKK